MRRISVVIPTYNRPELLSGAIQSVLDQTVPAHEIILVDDGSEPSTRELIDRLAAGAPSVRVHHLEARRGPSAARNFGIEAASGEFIVFLDDDDILDPRMLETSLRCFEGSPDCDVAICRSNVFTTEEPRTRPAIPFTFVNMAALERRPFSEILFYGVVIHSCMVRHSAIADLRFPEELAVGEDSYFWLRLALRGKRFKTNDGAYAHVRRHVGNATARRARDERVKEFYRKLIMDGLIGSRADMFFARAQLSMRLARRNDDGLLDHWAFMLKCPDLMPKFLWIYIDTKLKRFSNAIRLRLRDVT